MARRTARNEGRGKGDERVGKATTGTNARRAKKLGGGDLQHEKASLNGKCQHRTR